MLKNKKYIIKHRGLSIMSSIMSVDDINRSFYINNFYIKDLLEVIK